MNILSAKYAPPDLNAYNSYYLPTLSKGMSDIEELLVIKKQLEKPSIIRSIDFRNCHELSPTAISILAGIIRSLENRGLPTNINWNSANKNLSADLSQNGFMAIFGKDKAQWGENYIPFREDSCKKYDEDAILNHLIERVFEKNWISLSTELKGAIAGRLWEIFHNAFDHSDSELGVFSCGQHYAGKREIILSVVDFGHGIPNKVRTYFKQQDARYAQLSDLSCIQWAFVSGHTTDESVPRGLGLDLLREFVYINKGSLELRSGTGYAIADDLGVRFEECTTYFPGTCVQLKMVCDGRHYLFSSEG